MIFEYTMQSGGKQLFGTIASMTTSDSFFELRANTLEMLALTISFLLVRL